MKTLSLIISLLLFLVQAVQAEEEFDLDKIVVTSSRYATSDKESNSGISVIGQDMINQSGTKTIADVLKHVSGIYVTDNSTPKTQTVDIRGLGEFANRNVLVMIDGRKVNPVDISGPDWLQIPVETVQRIEIIRGSGSVLYGDNASAGVINIITKKPTQGTHGVVSAEFGSFNTQKESVQVSSRQGKIDGLVNVSRYQTDGYRNNSTIKAKDAFVKLGADPIEQIRVDASMNWHEDYYGLPGALLTAQLNSLGRRGTVKSDEFAETRDRAFDLTTTFDPWKDDQLGKFEVNGSYRNRDTYGYYPTLSSNTKYNIDTYGITGKYILSRDVLERSLDLVTGVDYYRNNNRITGSGAFNVDNIVISKDDIGTFINADYQLVDHLYLNAGTRYQKSAYTFDITNDNSFSGPSYKRTSPDVQISKTGLRYQYAEASNVFVDLEQTFRFLATDEVYSTFSGLNPDLKQQKGIQVQGGVKHQWGKAETKATLYWINTKNEIFLDPNLGGGFGANSNYDRTIRQGIELEQSFDIKKIFDVKSLEDWEIGADYTYQNPEFGKGPFKSNRIPLTPENMFGIFTDLSFSHNWHWRWDGRYVGDRYALNDESNTLDPLEPYFLVDTRLSYTFKNVEIFSSIDNLFAQKYFAFGGRGTNSTNRNYYPAVQRMLTAGMKVKF